MSSSKRHNNFKEGCPNQTFTTRWNELREITQQLDLYNAPRKKRFRIVPAGRRSGKTEIAKRVLAVVAMKDRSQIGKPPGRYFAAAPTREQAKRIWWNDLKALIHPDWRSKVSETELYIRTTLGNEIWVIGLNRPQRMEGVPWDGGIIDEYASCKPGIFDAHIRPALADRQGWLWFIGVPDLDGPAQVEYEGFYDRAVSGVDKEWGVFHWKSADVLPKEEVESARRSMDPRLFEQEFLGKFILAGGRAFPEFSIATHVRPTPYDPALPLCWSLDFNINPMCSGVIQHHKGHIRVIHEFALPDTITKKACITFLETAAAKNWNLNNLTAYGDATGSARDTTSADTDWTIVANMMRRVDNFRRRVPDSNPSIKDTINAVNTKLRDADGNIGLSIDPSCKRLIDDLKSALAGSDLHEQHCLAWLRYFIEWEYPVRSNLVLPSQPSIVL